MVLCAQAHTLKLEGGAEERTAFEVSVMQLVEDTEEAASQG